jgi:DNA-binding YbaB/EbfC family protein
MWPFKELGQFAGLLQQLPKIKAEMERLQQRLGQIVAEGAAGGGMVRVKVNGKLEVLSCSISDETFRLNDKEMLEDLIQAAANQALDKARQLAAEETSKMAAAFGLPAGLNLREMPT